MRWIEKQARYYQGYLADERSLIPVTILLANAVAIAAHVSSQFGRQSLPNADKFVAAPIHVGDLATRVG
jgi:hypothetical protein